jgi:hypothetical protein
MINSTHRTLVERILCVMLLILALRCLDAGAYRAVTPASGIFGVDFGSYYGAAKRLNDGVALYGHEQGDPRGPHVSSPLVPVLLRHVARRPVDQATRIWAALNVAALSIAVFLYCWGAGIDPLKNPVGPLLIMFTGFRFWPTVLELGIGNSDLILLCLITALFVCNRYRKWVLFALIVAVAALVKTWMICGLFYLLMRRKWGAAFACLGFLAVGMAILFTMVGWSQLPAMLKLTHSYSSQPMLVSHSIDGIARMYFQKNLIMTPFTTSHAAWLLVMAAGYGCLLAGLGYMWLRAPEMDESQLRTSLGLVFLALILGCPVTHQYYFVLALPVLWGLFFEPGDGKRDWVLPVMAFAVYLVFSVPTPGIDPIGAGFQNGIPRLFVGINFFCGALLWAGGLYAVARGFRAPSLSPSRVPAESKGILNENDPDYSHV